MKFLILIVIFSFSSIYYCDAMTCEEEGFFGITRLVSCPRPGDRPTAIYCCGSDKQVVCCDNPLGISEEDIQNLAKKLPAIIGTIIAIIISVIVFCIVCCCCCPFCILYKKRNRGAVHNPAPGSATYVTYQPAPTVTQMQPQQSYAPVTTSYANQPYPPQSQPSYPPQSQPSYPPASQGYGMTSQPGYFPPSNNAPYPVSQPPYPTTPLTASNEQPPPYAEKQLPFNPNY